MPSASAEVPDVWTPEGVPSDVASALVSDCVDRATEFFDGIVGFDVDRAQVIERPFMPRLVVYIPVVVGGSDAATMCPVYDWPASATIEGASLGPLLTEADLQMLKETNEYFEG